VVDPVPVPTTCLRCAVGCGLVQYGADASGGLERVTGDRAHPTTQGMACRRGLRETAALEENRLTDPLVRRGDELVTVTWAEALERATRGLGAALERDRDAVAVLGSGQQTNEAAYALGKLARGGLRTRYYDANTTLCMASAVTAYYDAFGSDAPPTTYDDISKAETHIIWGANPAVAHPVVFQWIRQSAAEDGSTLLVVDPVESETAAVADNHIAPAPGTDLALARAVLARLCERGECDGAFIEANTSGFERLRSNLPDVQAAATAADVSLEAVDQLADAFHQPTLVYWGMGINQSVAGTAAAGALIDCCLATGNLEPGSGPFSLTGQANSMGTRVCSSKGTWPGHRPFEDPTHREVVAETWGMSPSDLPEETGPGPVGILEAVETDVEAIYAVATNPAAGMPDASRARARLEDAFLVVQDAFHSETVAYADVVLPAATWGESNGTVMNMERTVSRVRPATAPPPGVKSDLEIIGEIATQIAPGLFDTKPAPEAMFDEFVGLTAGTPADCSGLSYERLDAELAVRWPAPDEQAAGGYRYYEEASDSSEVENSDSDSSEGPSWTFPTPTGTARFSQAVSTTAALPEPTDDRYPLTLTTARQPDSYNTGVRGREATVVARVNPETVRAAVGELPERATTETDDADETPLQARVRSRRGTVVVRLESETHIPEGVVWLPIHHPATNELTVPAVDPRSNEPNYKQCAVALEGVDTAASDGATESPPR